MVMTTGQGPLILGATGRIGRALARVWPAGQAAVWQHRPGRIAPARPAVSWDILRAPAPDLPASLTGIVLLAGPVSGDFSATTPLARVAADLAERLGLRLLVASSQAVYGAPAGPVDETAALSPVTAYAQAKAEMERAVAGRATCLRIGNVAGCDGLLGAAARQSPLGLTCLADGTTPQRSYIGPATLARVLCDLLAHQGPLPDVLNLAQPGVVAMGDLLDAAGVAHVPKPQTPADVPRLELDVSALAALVDLPAATAAGLVAEARAAGWSAAP